MTAKYRWSAACLILSLIGWTVAAVVVDRSMVRSGEAGTLWPAYDASLKGARYIDLTHAFAPGQPRGVGLVDLSVSAARAAADVPGLVRAGNEIGYAKQGVAITAYRFGSDQIGTQLDPPAH